jgi:hypothetical protein
VDWRHCGGDHLNVGTFSSRRAGVPCQRSPSGTVPDTQLPDATSAPAPMSAPGISIDRVPTEARGPTRMPPTCSKSPSIHQPAQSTSGSRTAPSPNAAMPVTGGNECSWTSRPTRHPRIRA